MRKYEEAYEQELAELDELKGDGEISLETWELMRDDLDLRYPDEDPEEMNSYPDLW